MPARERTPLVTHFHSARRTQVEILASRFSVTCFLQILQVGDATHVSLKAVGR